MVTTVVFRIGLVFTILAILNYLIDTYSFEFAASAVVSISLLPAFFAFSFPLFGELMYTNLGIG